MKISFQKAQQAIRAYGTMQNSTIASANKLLSLVVPLIEERQQEEKRLLTSATFLMKRFAESRLNRYDLLDIAGFHPKEDDLSNAIASLIDPRESHGLGIQPLRNILVNIKGKYSSIKEKINSILPDLASQSIKVDTRLDWGESKPDIVVEGELFLISIENKLSYGIETVRQGKYQTARQWKALQREGARKQISDNSTLAIYLSPQSKPSHSKHVVAVSVGLLTSAIREAVMSSSTRYRDSILSFLDFYDRY